MNGIDTQSRAEKYATCTSIYLMLSHIIAIIISIKNNEWREGGGGGEAREREKEKGLGGGGDQSCFSIELLLDITM